jgi:hypothetical protein
MRAEAQFKKALRAEEGQKAMAEYEAAAIALREKTARLKALRLAKEAATPVHQATTLEHPTKKKTAVKAKRS